MLDNASIHTAHLVRERHAAWTAAELTLLFLPPYSPELNKIEMRWHRCKHYWVRSEDYHTDLTLLERIENVLLKVEKNTLLLLRNYLIVMEQDTATAEGTPAVAQTTSVWTFGGRWNSLTGQRSTAPVDAAQQDIIVEKMLVFQRSVGGWPKAIGEVKVNYNHRLSAAECACTLDDRNRNDVIIDNNATTREILYLVEAFRRTNNPAYRQAAKKGIRYLLTMQYANGGFPQFYPDLSSYRHQITYNDDDAMVCTFTILRGVAQQKDQFTLVDPHLVPAAKGAVRRGIACNLGTQYRQPNGRLSAWCAQYDEKTLRPAKARACELASLSGDESVSIVRFLMGIDRPSEAVKTTVESAVT